MKKPERVMRRLRRMPRNLLRDRRTMDDILDEMATKWAAKAEKLQTNAFSKMQTKTFK